MSSSMAGISALVAYLLKPTRSVKSATELGRIWVRDTSVRDSVVDTNCLQGGVTWRRFYGRGRPGCYKKDAGVRRVRGLLTAGWRRQFLRGGGRRRRRWGVPSGRPCSTTTAF